MTPVVVALHVTPASRAALLAKPTVRVLEDTGVEGDRHAKAGSRRQVLLVEAEVLERFGLSAGDVREQVTVRGMDLYGPPIGARLRIGDAEFEFGGPCAPCGRMDEIRQGLRARLEGCRGRFVRVVRGGSLAVGDPIEIAPAG